VHQQAGIQEFILCDLETGQFKANLIDLGTQHGNLEKLIVKKKFLKTRHIYIFSRPAESQINLVCFDRSWFD